MSITFFVLLAVCPGIVLSQISITVAPPLVESSIPAGGFRSLRLVVSNVGDKPVDIKGYTCDLKLSPDGTPLVLDPGVTPYSCAGWIGLTENRFKLDGRSKKVIGATIKLPRGEKGGKYALILFEAVPLGTRKSGSVLLGARLGTIVMVTIPWTLKKEAHISQIKVEKASLVARPDGKDKKVPIQTVGFTVSLKNTGNVHINAKGSLVIKNNEGRIIDRIPLEGGTGTVLPEGVRDFSGKWSNTRKMVKGKYTAEARISYGGRTQARAEKTFLLE